MVITKKYNSENFLLREKFLRNKSTVVFPYRNKAWIFLCTPNWFHAARHASN